ncbi:pre-rRNA-processing protein esf2 [Rutidosis leptorrhynchoides]|uniref:pre-rRNA-processing protein esf2 n=1 Tax=Rutidosis leptorrhynchoides TaxID=125765 RepID=UPI003A9A4111
MVEEELVKTEDLTKEQPNVELDDLKAERKERRKRRLLKEAAKANKRGVCYLSRIPPRMDPLKLRQLLSQYGELERIYLTPEDPAANVHRKKAGGFRGIGFTEGWVEFTNKNVAKRVASMLNGEQIGGKKKSLFYYDLWNIKYLSKFKWDHLTEEIAYKNATREQKLALELSAARKERDFYLKKVDQSRAISSIDERLKKKRKIQEADGSTAEISGDQQAAKVIRQFRQTKPVRDGGDKQKQGLSKDLLAGVFGGSS